MVKYFLFGLSVFCLAACHKEPKNLVSSIFIDSLIRNYAPPAAVKANGDLMAFWKARINPERPGMVNESQYAATLTGRFHLLGDIHDLKSADSVLQKIEITYNQKEAGPLLALVALSITQHRFNEADSFLQKAIHIGLKKYDLLTASFDVDFEKGRYDRALEELKALKSDRDYGYYFRRSKMDHLNGLLDSARNAMMKAAGLSELPYLKQVALSNAGDLAIHAGQMQQAAQLYKDCIAISSADFHSLMGLGWIALVHDQNDSLAERIFRFVQSKLKSPDAVFKLSQMADQRGDTVLQKKEALEFQSLATDSLYGNMYNKYLIELYTGILQEPAQAVVLAQRELNSRATPQTYAWYAWSLLADRQPEAAYKVYQENVSGRPLEGLELYWMGRLMESLGKGYNAQAFFKAAYKNKYDLSPGMVKDLEKKAD